MFLEPGVLVVCVCAVQQKWLSGQPESQAASEGSSTPSVATITKIKSAHDVLQNHLARAVATLNKSSLQQELLLKGS